MRDWRQPVQQDYIPRMIELEHSDHLFVKRMAEERGVSEEVLLAALYKIIRKFQGLQIEDPKLKYGEYYFRCLVDLGFIEQPSTS
jgi:hypothetical protein